MWRQSLYGTCCYLSISFHTTYQYRTQSAFRMKLTTVWFFPHTLSVNIKLTAINFNGPVFLILYTTPVWNSLSSWTKTYSSTLFQYGTLEQRHSSTLFQYGTRWALEQRHTLKHYSSMELTKHLKNSSTPFQYGTHCALEQRHTLPHYFSIECTELLYKDILFNTIPIWDS